MKNILISGGSDGLGKEIAKKLSPDNKVIILSHNREKLLSVSQELKCDFVEADVTDYSSVSTAIETVLKKYSNIDVLVNNAGIWTEGGLEENEPEKIKEILNVNTLGTIFLSKAVIPAMKANKGGRIINIISQDGLKSKKNRSVYSASKWAITGFTKCLQEDLSGFHIGVTGIHPGLMNTTLFAKQGIKRDLSNSLELSEVASLVEYVINLSPDTFLPEISIKNINNTNTMDDTSAPKTNLDLNPDMMTTQTSIPVIDPLTTVASKSSGVIDITPGVSDASHPSKVEDITPKDFGLGAPKTEPVVSAPAPITTISDVITDTAEPAGIIDITPGASNTTTQVVTPVVGTATAVPENTISDTGTHLADFVPSTPTPTPTTAIAPAAEVSQPTTPVITAPTVTETPVISTTTTTETVITPAQSEMPMMAATPVATPAPVEVVQPQIAPASPFAEDPDQVKTNQ